MSPGKVGLGLRYGSGYCWEVKKVRRVSKRTRSGRRWGLYSGYKEGIGGEECGMGI